MSEPYFSTSDTASTQFNRWAAKRRADPNLPFDAATAAARWLEIQSIELAEQPLTAKNRRGRPAQRTENPIATHMILIALDQPAWLDDIIHGSIASSVGTTKGQLNVRSSEVTAALYLKAISVEAVKRPDMPDRSARSIAQAARHAARGIDHYLNNQPQLLEVLKLERTLAYRSDELRQGI